MRRVYLSILCMVIFACLILTGSVSVVCSTPEIGSGWGIATLIETDNTAHAYSPQVAMDDSGNAIAVWHQDDGIRYNIWSNRYYVGTGWGVATLIETNNAGYAYRPQVAVDGSGNAIAVWFQSDGVRTSIWSNRYLVGAGWGAATLIETNDVGDADYPQVSVVDSGNGIAVWCQTDGVGYTTWSNRYVVGSGWGAPTPIETHDGDSWRPQVAMDDSGNAIAVWEQFDGARYNIWSNRYVVGTGWGAATLIETNDIEFAQRPQICVDGSGNAMAVWQQEGGTSNIWSNRYVAGTGWSTATLVETDDTGDARFPQVAVDDSGNVIAVWHQNDGFLTKIRSNRYVEGTGWGTPTIIQADDAGDSVNPQVAVDDLGNAIAVWYQDDDNIWSNRYIAGTGWSTATLIETDNAGDVWEPDVAMDGSGNAIAVWRQSDGTRYNIWANRYVEPDITPPPLSLVSPTDGLTTETPVVTASGTTESGVSLVINGLSVAVESDGSFSCDIGLVEGENTITAIATDASDNSAAVSVSVIYVNPIVLLEEELNDALEDLYAVQDELNETLDELNAIRDDLDAAEEELTSTSDDLESLKSQNLALMAVLAIVAILAVVMSVMFMSLRKKIAGMEVKAADEEPPPPQS